MAYKLVWFDEFSNDGRPDPSKWQLEQGGHGFGNNELQYYTDFEHNAYVKDGHLMIKAYREIYGEHHYTSAKLTTYGLKSFQYGKLLIRAKLPKGAGTWPAIWMLPNSMKKGVSWPRSGEIDIMEHVGKDPQTVHFSLHTALYNHKSGTQYTYFEHIDGVDEAFHEYGIEWTPEYMAFLVDEREVVRYVRGSDNRDIEELGWPFDQKFYLILNLAVGGFWGGPVDDHCLPAALEVDYVRYYELVENM